MATGLLGAALVEPAVRPGGWISTSRDRSECRLCRSTSPVSTFTGSPKSGAERSSMPSDSGELVKRLYEQGVVVRDIPPLGWLPARFYNWTLWPAVGLLPARLREPLLSGYIFPLIFGHQ